MQHLYIIIIGIKDQNKSVKEKKQNQKNVNGQCQVYNILCLFRLDLFAFSPLFKQSGLLKHMVRTGLLNLSSKTGENTNHI